MTETCRNLGLNLEDGAELGRLERLLMDGEKKRQVRKWSFSALRLHERLELWLGTNGRGRTEGRLMARSRGLNNGVIFGRLGRGQVFGRPGVLVKVSDPAEENLDFVAYETCLEIINLRQYPDPIDGFDYCGAEYPLRISAFAKGLRYYRNERAWRKAETRLAKEAMIPDECLKQRREKDPDPVCFLSGIVGEAERIPRDLSPGDRGGSDDAAVLLNEDYFYLRLRLKGTWLDVLAGAHLFGEEPAPGGVVQGEFWLSAVILGEEGSGNRQSAGSA